MIKKFPVAWIWLPTVALVACSATFSEPVAEPGRSRAIKGPETMDARKKDTPLPYARGNTFESLDEYLLYLERFNGPIDMPYWRVIGPGRYEWVTTMRPLDGGKERQVATRAELMQRYGFEK